MNMITGYLSPTSGTVRVNGYDIADEPEKAKSQIGYLPEIPPVYPDMTPQEYLTFAGELKKVPKKELKAEVERVMELTGISHMRNRLIKNLSKGYRQRVGFSCALLGNPKIIILDEPTAMLDPNGRKDVIRTVHELNKKEGITVLLITHYMEEAIDADRVIVMDDGKVIMDGVPKEIFSRVKELKEHGLDVPQATELAYELKEAGMPLTDGILSREELAEQLMALFTDEK